MSRPQEPAALNREDVDRAIQMLRTVTRENGLKNSSVREAVARAALQRQGHFTVEDLISDLKAQSDGHVHSATVYRVLPLLVDAGLLQVSLLSRGESATYERAFEREHHDHLICTECGKVVEFHFEALEALQRDIATQYGFQLKHHVHELLGECSECANKSSAKD